MLIIKGLEWTFDTVAAKYEKMRPGYVAELYQEIFDYIPISEDSNVIEVGSGGGQATEPLLKTGCKLTAIEYGREFSSLLQNKFREYPKFEVITGKFEETELESNTYDLIFSASAFHWVPEEIGYRKVLKEYTEEETRKSALIAGRYGFSDITYSLFYRERVFSAKEYTELLGTYSDHIAIEETMRNEFFEKISNTIDKYGGTITICDTIDLQMARKRV